MIYYYYIRVSYLKGSQFFIKSYLVSFCRLKEFFDFISKKSSSDVILITAYNKNHILHSQADRRFL